MGRDYDVLLHRHGMKISVAVSAHKFQLSSQAKNIVNYLRLLHRIIAPGGVWINLGGSSRRECPLCAFILSAEL